MIYGYVRVSTKSQKMDRQIETLTNRYGSDIVIFSEFFTGTTMDRPQWQKLMQKVQEGDTIVFDEISRMSRNAEEGFNTYKELLDKGIELEFIKEATLNTVNFRATTQIAMTGTEVDCILEGVNKYLMVLAENQIRTAFDTAQHELNFRAIRQAEGIAIAKEKRAENGQAMWGRQEGQKVNTEKVQKAMDKIRKYSRRFDGTMNDTEVMKLVEISRGTFYRYLKEM